VSICGFRTLQDGIFEVLFSQKADDQTAGQEMHVVFTKGKDGQTLILFKNFEFQRNNAGEYIPLHSNWIQMTPAYETQIRTGVHMMQRKIRLAIGETCTY